MAYHFAILYVSALRSKASLPFLYSRESTVCFSSSPRTLNHSKITLKTIYIYMYLYHQLLKRPTTDENKYQNVASKDPTLSAMLILLPPTPITPCALCKIYVTNKLKLWIWVGKY